MKKWRAIFAMNLLSMPRVSVSLKSIFVLTALVGVYLGIYVSISNPIDVVERHAFGISQGHRAAHYEIRLPFVETIFWPAHCVDYVLRPQYWENFQDPIDIEFTELGVDGSLPVKMSRSDFYDDHQ